MASAHDLVLNNFVYRIEAIAVGTTIVRKPFRVNTNSEAMPGEMSKGMVRTFTVYYAGADNAHEVQDLAEQALTSTWSVEVAYPKEAGKGEIELQRLILQDAHLLRAALRDPANYDGVSDTSPATETHLVRREFIEETLDRDGTQAWYLLQTWSCTTFEAE